jgi:hypothetical protein
VSPLLTPDPTASERCRETPPGRPRAGRFVVVKVNAVSGGFPGLGTVINVATVVVGALLGMWVGHRLPERTRSVVTDCLGLTTHPGRRPVVRRRDRSTLSRCSRHRGAGPHRAGVVGGRRDPGSAAAPRRSTRRPRGGSRRVARHTSARPQSTGEAAADAAAADGSEAGHAARERFIEGWLTASLLFCVGPLTILGSLSDGLGRGIDQLTLKAVLDGFAALAFASSFGLGVLLSAVSVAVVQGSPHGAWASSAHCCPPPTSRR